MVICVAAMVCLLTFFASRRFSVSNYYTTLYFSSAKFHEIEPGMTRREVLDGVGIPLKRRRLQRGEWYWTYSLPMDPNRPYRQFEVCFDSSTGRVVRASHNTNRLSKDRKTGQWIGLFPPRPAAAWEIAHFDLPMVQGRSPMINTEVEKVYLIQVTATWCRPCVGGRIRVETLLKEILSDVPVSLLLVSVDESEQTLREYLSKNQVTYPVAWDPNRRLAKPMSQKLIPKYLLLKGRTLYPFDFPHYTGESEEYYGDLAWFIRHHTGSNFAP